MKKTQEILGLPIISISDGMEVGKVKSIIINADKGAIDYIVVDNGVQILSARVIPTENILGIGEYAVTIENDSAINDISKIPNAIDLLQKNIQVKGTKVLTKKGRLIGEIGDLYIDENECCKITGLEYIADITQKRIRLIPRESVITFGKNLVVVTDGVEETLLDRSTQLGSGERPAEGEKKNLANFDSKGGDNNQVNSNLVVQLNSVPVEDVTTYVNKVIATEVADYYKSMDVTPVDEFKAENIKVGETLNIFSSEEVSVNETDSINVLAEIENIEVSEPEQLVSEEVPFNGGTFPDSNSPSESIVQNSPAPAAENNAASLFEQRQKQYLNGRRSTKTIADNSGNVIVSEGMQINNDIIETAKIHGKLIELVMNNKA